MSTPLVLAALWVIAGAVTAMLPMRLQYAPGLALLIAAPALLVWVGAAHGPWLALAGLAGFVSMFRRPLGHFWRRGAAALARRGRATRP